MGRSTTFSLTLTALTSLSGVSAYAQTTTYSEEMAEKRKLCYGEVVEWGLTDTFPDGEVKLRVTAPDLPTIYYSFSHPEELADTPIYQKDGYDQCMPEPIPTKYFDLFIGIHPSDVAATEAFYRAFHDRSDKDRAAARIEVFATLTLPEALSQYNTQNLVFAHKEKMDLRRKIEQGPETLRDDGTFYTTREGRFAGGRLEAPVFLLSNGGLTEPVTKMPALYECRGWAIWDGQGDYQVCSTNYLLESGVELHYDFIYQLLPRNRIPDLDKIIREIVEKHVVVEPMKN